MWAMALNGPFWNRLFYVLSPKCACSQTGTLTSASTTGFVNSVTGCTSGGCMVSGNVGRRKEQSSIARGGGTLH